MSETNDLNENETNEPRGKKSHGFLKFLIVVLIIGATIFGLVKCAEYKSTVNSNTSQGNSDGNTHLLSRSARNSDITVESDLDLSSFGAKYTVMPQTDIDNLEITISFLDENKNVLTSFEKLLGDVKESVQVSFSISLFDMSLTVALQTRYESWTVTGGTVSYFA